MLLLAVAAWQAVSVQRFVARATAIPGKVTALHARDESDGIPLYAPRVRFMTPEGREMEFESPVASYTSSTGSIGRSVEVLYLPGEEPRIHSFRALWYGPGTLGFFGAVCAALGVGLYAFFNAGKNGSVRTGAST